MEKLKNQSEFTQTAILGGENGGGFKLTEAEGIVAPRDALELARSWTMLSR
jgi:hypothetical protein